MAFYSGRIRRGMKLAVSKSGHDRMKEVFKAMRSGLSGNVSSGLKIAMRRG